MLRRSRPEPARETLDVLSLFRGEGLQAVSSYASYASDSPYPLSVRFLAMPRRFRSAHGAGIRNFRKGPCVKTRKYLCNKPANQRLCQWRPRCPPHRPSVGAAPKTSSPSTPH